MKRKALTDFLPAHSLPEVSPLVPSILDKEVVILYVQNQRKLYFDGASRSSWGKEKEEEP